MLSVHKATSALLFTYQILQVLLRSQRPWRQNSLQGDHGTLQQTFVYFTSIDPMAAGFGLDRRKPGRIDIESW